MNFEYDHTERLLTRAWEKVLSSRPEPKIVSQSDLLRFLRILFTNPVSRDALDELTTGPGLSDPNLLEEAARADMAGKAAGNLNSLAITLEGYEEEVHRSLASKIGTLNEIATKRMASTQFGVYTPRDFLKTFGDYPERAHSFTMAQLEDIGSVVVLHLRAMFCGCL